MAWHVGPAGVEDPGIAASGFPRNLGDLPVSVALFGLLGAADPNGPWPPASVRAGGSEAADASGGRPLANPMSLGRGPGRSRRAS